MAPDIQVYANLQSVFRGEKLRHGHTLSVADRYGPGIKLSLRNNKPFKLVSARASVAEILDILKAPIVHQAFDFDECK